MPVSEFTPEEKINFATERAFAVRRSVRPSGSSEAGNVLKDRSGGTEEIVFSNSYAVVLCLLFQAFSYLQI